MPYNKQLLLKLKQQSARDASNAAALSADYSQKDKRYWLLNIVSNRRSDKTITMDEYLAYVGRKVSVSSMYQLVPAWKG